MTEACEIIDEVLAAYCAARGEIAVVHLVRRLLDREPEAAELAMVRRAVRERAAWVAEADVTFDTPPEANATRATQRAAR